MLKSFYAGSFDPITNGHIDIIKRASKISDKLFIGILENPNKKYLFSIEERINLINKVLVDLKNIEVVSFNGLLVDIAKSLDITLLIRGIRNVTDFDCELQRSLINKNLDKNIETIFLPACSNHLSTSSTAVKEIAIFGGNIDGMVPELVKQAIFKKYEKRGF